MIYIDGPALADGDLICLAYDAYDVVIVHCVIGRAGDSLASASIGALDFTVGWGHCIEPVLIIVLPICNELNNNLPGGILGVWIGVYTTLEHLTTA